MITRKDGLRYAKLIHVSVDHGTTMNSNKVYIMEEQADGRIKCDYGRVGKNLQTTYKPVSQWNKIYNSKTSERKKYKDITSMIVESEENSNTTNKKIKDIEEDSVKVLFNDLMMFANKSIQQNYKVTQDAVTEAQIDVAQEVLTSISKVIKQGLDIKIINDKLIELYTIIPRKMSDVRDHLIKSMDTKADVGWVKDFISNEQDTLDTMSGQVKLLKQQKPKVEDKETDKEIDILEQMGLDVSEETNQESIDLIHKLLGRNVNQAKKIFKCINAATQKQFDDNLKISKNKKRRLYWHGSRNENIFNITQTGLMIRPSGAIHTGSAFGDGIYFASKAQKSIGYSSLSNSYWANGNSNKAYLLLFDVLLGKQYIVNHSDSSLSKSKIKRLGDYDSTYAKPSHDGFLRNEEFIIYDGNQCTIAYIIEMGN